MMNKIIEKTLDVLREQSPRFQDYINNRYNRLGYCPVDTSILKDAIVTYKGNKYFFTDRLNSLKWCESDYDFSDVTTNDVVLDIGAEFGALSIPISRKCKHVYAVEIDPAMRALLLKNISMNDIKNITVLNVGLIGNEEMGQFQTPTRTLAEIINSVKYKPNVLKLDCEGAEWSITPDDLSGIDMIEGEIHNLKGFGIQSGRGNRRFVDYLNMLNYAGFDVTHSEYQDLILLIHAKRRNRK